MGIFISGTDHSLVKVWASDSQYLDIGTLKLSWSLFRKKTQKPVHCFAISRTTQVRSMVMSSIFQKLDGFRYLWILTPSRIEIQDGNHHGCTESSVRNNVLVYRITKKIQRHLMILAQVSIIWSSSPLTTGESRKVEWPRHQILYDTWTQMPRSRSSYQHVPELATN